MPRKNSIVTTVMVKDLSRLGRDYVSVGNYTDSYFPDHNVRFIAVNDGIDSDEGESEIAVLFPTRDTGVLMLITSLFTRYQPRHKRKKTVPIVMGD